MKRFLILFIVALMAISMMACGSSQNSADSGTLSTPSPQNSPTPSPTASPKPVETKAPEASPKPDDVKAPEETPKPEESKGPVETAKPAETKAPAAETPKPAATKAPEETAKAAEPAAPAPTSAPEKAEVSANGKKLLMVGRENAQEDTFVANRLKALGFKVTVLADRDFTVDETKGFDLIYFSQTTNSKILKEGVMKEVAIPTVYVKSQAMFYLGLSSIEENANVFNVKSIDIVDSKHKVAGGLSGTVDIYKETGSKIGISFGQPGKEAKVIATAPGDKTKAAIYYYDKGTKADNGYEVKARVSFFYLNNGMQENTTDNGWKLLDNITLWTLHNE
ncbi:hypothetical protein [Paenibacillus sp. UNC451MF]|uniref:hypothetical protein n=1 Tax=Paenibacillus sp. UNC451MF TaxID=1449063 RepID=UPI00048BFED8|nr:hypothetical protein [Paenibacillus sp. UNC451MF]